MAKGSIMLQIAVERTFSGLDGRRTVVREIASEKSHAVMVLAAQNNVVVPAMADVLRTVSGRGTAR